MTAFPIIFKPADGFSPSLDIQFSKNTQWVEFVSHIVQFGESDVPETHGQLNQLLQFEGDPSRRAILLAGIGRYYIHEGYFLKGAQTLGYAHSLLPDNSTNENAFILLEMIAFLAINGQHDLSLLLLERVPNLTSMEYLLRLADYYGAVHKTRSGSLEDVQGLLDSVVYFENIQLHSTMAYHYKNIGNVYRKYSEFDLAKEYYDQAIQISKKYSYTHIEAAVQHDIGMLHFRLGNFQKGLQTLEGTLDIAENHYTRSFIHANMGFILMRKQRIEEATRHFQKSLNIAVNNGIHHMIAGCAYYLGECHKQTENIELASYFYRKGYEAATELLKQHFPYSGDRMLAVEGYNKFLVNHQNISTSQSPKDDFSFAIDKSLKEIRGLFQNVILESAVRETGSIKSAAKKMDMSERTFFSVKKRNAEYAIDQTPTSVKSFLIKNSDLKWKELNQKFESTILSFLYSKYGVNKKFLSKKLDISYARTLQLTTGFDRFMTHADIQ